MENTRLKARLLATLIFVFVSVLSYAQYATLDDIITLGKMPVITTANVYLKSQGFKHTGGMVDNSGYPTLNVYYYCKKCTVNNNGDMVGKEEKGWSYFELSLNVSETKPYTLGYSFSSKVMYNKYLDDAIKKGFAYSLQKKVGEDVYNYYVFI